MVEWEILERDHFKRIRDTKETFHASMGKIKDRNSKDLMEAEEIKKNFFFFKS